MKTARLSLRPEEEKRAVSKVEDAYGNSYDYATMREAKDQVSDLLDEDHADSKPHSVRRNLQQAQEQIQTQPLQETQENLQQAQEQVQQQQQQQLQQAQEQVQQQPQESQEQLPTEAAEVDLQ